MVQQRKNQSCQSKNKSCLISSALDKKYSELLTYEQPKALTISGTKGYITITEYPRAQSADFYHVDSDTTEYITEGSTENALFYEISDFESIIADPSSIQSYKTITDDVFTIFEHMKTSWSQ